MMSSFRSLLGIVLFLCTSTYAQVGKPIAPVQSFKFGQISRAEMVMAKHPTDPDAQAIILFEIGSNKLFLGGHLNSNFKLHRRIKILSEAAASKWSNIFVNYDENDARPAIHASVFTLNTDSSIIELKFDSKDVYTEKVLKQAGMYRLRATLPKVSVGSIIEYEYSIDGSGLSIRDWVFQYDEPVLYSEFSFVPPAMVYFEHFFLGNLEPSVTQKSGETVFLMKNIPALREQPFTSNIRNYRCQIKFRPTQVGSLKIAETWGELFSDLLQTPDFNHYSGGPAFRGIAKPLTKNTKEKNEIIKNLYEHVVNTISWDSTYSFIPNPTPKKLIEKKNGNSASLNMYLLNLLKEAKIKSDMVLVSTRSNGTVGTIAPFIRQYNHLLIRAFISDSTYWLLDCTDKTLPYYLLNDEYLFILGLVVKQGAYEIIVSQPNAGLTEVALANFTIRENGDLEGDLTLKYKYYSAIQKRSQIKNKDINEWIRQTYFPDYSSTEVTNATCEGIVSINDDLTAKAHVRSLDLVQVVNDELYLNPLIIGRIIETPFKLENRTYPVDLINAIDRNLTVNITLPDGWELLDALKNISVAIPSNKAKFRRSAVQNGNHVSIQLRLQVAAGSYSVEEYPGLREFYDRLIKVMAEQIIIKKKS